MRLNQSIARRWDPIRKMMRRPFMSLAIRLAVFSSIGTTLGVFGMPHSMADAGRRKPVALAPRRANKLRASRSAKVKHPSHQQRPCLQLHGRIPPPLDPPPIGFTVNLWVVGSSPDRGAKNSSVSPVNCARCAGSSTTRVADNYCVTPVERVSFGTSRTGPAST